MSVTLLYSCGHIEMSVGDMDAARGFMQQVLGAGPIEQQMAAEITGLFPDGGYAVEHLDCGEAVFQFNAPTAGATVGGHKTLHQTYLERVGACVTNLNYYVDDGAHARDLLNRMGAKTCLEGPADIIRCLADYGPENTLPPEPARRFFFMGSRELIGLDLELVEPNFRRVTAQTVQYPCFLHPRPAVTDGNLKLLRLRLVVRDLEAAYDNLSGLVAPASRSKAYDIRRGRLAHAFRITLGGLELEYCQPLADQGPLADQLGRFGPGVIAADFAARDLARVARRAQDSGAPVEPEGDPLGLESPAARTLIRSRDLVGFDVALEPAERPAL